LSEDAEIDMRVRPFQSGDGEALGTIFYRSVREGGLRAYTREQVEAWAPAVPPASLYERKSLDGRVILLTIDAQGRQIAYGDIEPSGHIDHLFCIPESIGKGAASMLYGRLEAQAREWKLGRLFVEASELARPFFERKGFTMIQRNNFIRAGVLMHNYQMEKILA
jgi:putative acetyltransferase